MGTYQIELTHADGRSDCIIFTERPDDRSAIAFARSVLDMQFDRRECVTVLREDTLVFTGLSAGKRPNRRVALR